MSRTTTLTILLLTVITIMAYQPVIKIDPSTLLSDTPVDEAVRNAMPMQGSDGIGDSLYPQMGNGGYDVLHYEIEIKFSPEENYIDATTTINAVATHNLNRFNLDFYGLDIEHVIVDSVSTLYERNGTELIITPVDVLNAGDIFTATISYTGVPQPIYDPGVALMPLGWQEWSTGYFATVSQPSGSMNWFPSNNHPRDKATFTFNITVPQPNIVAANGIRRSIIDNEDGTRTFVWDMRYPMATYLAMVAIGDFVEVRDQVRGISIRSFFPPDTPQEVIDAHHNLRGLIGFLNRKLGPYPFDAYGVVIVPGFGPVAALETQTLSIFSPQIYDEDTIRHELFHQWIGNSLTLSDWSDIWLHEGSARYFEILWHAEKSLPTQYNTTYNNAVRSLIMSIAMNGSRAPGNVTVDDLFGGSTYLRGALIWHGLREQVGKRTFNQILRTYYQTYAYQNAASSDLISISEEISQQDLGDFFQTWLYEDALPVDAAIPLANSPLE